MSFSSNRLQPTPPLRHRHTIMLSSFVQIYTSLYFTVVAFLLTNYCMTRNSIFTSAKLLAWACTGKLNRSVLAKNFRTSILITLYLTFSGHG